MTQERTRLPAIENIENLIAQDIERQVRQMVDNGWDPHDAFTSAASWWAGNIVVSTEKARRGLKDTL